MQMNDQQNLFADAKQIFLDLALQGQSNILLDVWGQS